MYPGFAILLAIFPSVQSPGAEQDTAQPAVQDRRVFSFVPTLWWNDASDATVGVRVRETYLGRLDRKTWWVGRGIRGVEQTTAGPVDLYFRWENPTFLSSTNASQSLEAWTQDGTLGARLRVSKEKRRSFTSSSFHRTGWLAQWVATRETNFLDPLLWDNAGTVEVGRLDNWGFGAWGGRWSVKLDSRTGIAYDRAGGRTGGAEPFLRFTGSASVRKPMEGFVLGARAFAGVYVADDRPVSQRAIPLHGADPYQTLGNPFVRTEGALLVQNDIFYHSPGNGNLRGFRPGLGGRWILAGNIELERFLFRMSSGMVRSAALVAFADGAIVDTLAVRSFAGSALTPVSDGGIGARISFQVGDLTLPLRVEFPLFVSEPRYAHETIPGKNRLGFRWLISLRPIF